MSFNSKILGILLALVTVVMVISAVSAVDFVNENFKIAGVSGADFTETVNISTDNINLVIFENSADSSDDIDSIIFFKDSTEGKKELSGFIKDLQMDGKQVDETDKYIVLKNTRTSSEFEIPTDIDGAFDFAGNLFSGDDLNISSGGNSFSLSKEGLEISDAEGQNVAITADGVSVSGDASNETVNVSSNVSPDVINCDYSIYLKNQDNNGVIVLSGNNLDSLKVIAEETSFNEN